MTGLAVFAIAVLGLAVLAVVASSVVSMFGPVDRKRVERFMRRQTLAITPDNGDLVIRYLATTRRWRGGLFLVVSVLWLSWRIASREEVSVQFLPALAGWFVGAVAAEWRVDALARGPRSAALLRRRRIADYAPRLVVALATIVWLAVVALAVAVATAGWRGSADRIPAGATVLAVVVAGVALVLVMRRILDRPQPLVAPDLLAADNAIRGRSLNVLLGSAVALGGYLGAASAGQLTGSSNTGSGDAALIGFLLLPLLGFVVARSPRPIPASPAGAAGVGAA